jgi:hypothetical protein
MAFMTLLIPSILMTLTGCGGLFGIGGSSAPDEVALADLEPESLEIILPEDAACPGTGYGFAVALDLGDHEILAMPSGMRPDFFRDSVRPRIEAALEGGEFVELSELEISVEGPATFQGSLTITADPARALEGPGRITAASPHHDVDPATATLPIRFNCSYDFDGRGARGRDGQDGQAGQNGGGEGPTEERHGTAGGPGGTGGDGGAGADVEIVVVAFRGPDGRDWAQVVARNVTQGTERKYLLPPDATLNVSAEGGRGGSGGRGGVGGEGREQVGSNWAGDGGDGGAGGQGGSGGPGGRLRIIVDPAVAGSLRSFIDYDADGGRGGAAGSGGPAGDSGMYNMDGSPQAVQGRDGPAGSDGPAGPAGEVAIEERRMEPPFTFDMARLEATLDGTAATTTTARPSASTPAATSGGSAEPPSTHGANDAPPRNTGGTNRPPQRPGPAESAAAEGSELASGRFAVVALSLSGGGRTVISLAPNGEVTSGRSVIGRLDGGTYLDSRGEVAFALSRDGTLHAKTRNGFQQVARILPNGRVTWEGRDLEVRVGADGRITRRARGRNEQLEARFARVPRNALRTAGFLAYMAAGALR